jgi:hypothetical protein
MQQHPQQSQQPQQQQQQQQPANAMACHPWPAGQASYGEEAEPPKASASVASYKAPSVAKSSTTSVVSS